MPDNDTTTDNVDRGIRWDMETQLAVGLPGLSDKDLSDLGVRVGEELHLRVGRALGAGLTDKELKEFEQLLDGGDERLCDKWLESHRPNFRATVATVLADLVAEVVRKVTEANPAAAQGNRVIAQLLRASINLAETHFDSQGIQYTRNENGLLAVLEGEDDGPETLVWVAMAGRHADTFTLTGSAAGIDFAPEEHERLCAFAADWNRRTWNPKAVVITDEDTGRCKVMGEVAASTGPRITRAQVDVMFGRGFGSILALLAEARQSLSVPKSDGQMTPIDADAGGSVIRT
ncbi:YbjN domain-containing protein [Mycolicibacterium tusciae]|uniref:YbjN domain-containing protein n=1 Tax=Mycolicibacterium tusciae TaxID=75922 RepID=UPI00024A47E5|nr:DUF5663 domain-containing protein [Mycolicibacterium tusciae]